jgi:hypothetical protein
VSTATPTAPSQKHGFKKLTVGSYTQEKVVADDRAIPETYKPFLDSGAYGPVVPGIKQGLVPQGLAYYADSNWLIISSYQFEDAPSLLSIVDLASNQLLKTLVLYENVTKPYKGHAGGIAISAKHLWIGGENEVRAISLNDIVKAEDGGHVVFSEQFRPETKATFISYSDSMLWIGEFYDVSEKPNRITDRHRLSSTDNQEHHAWVAGYKLDSATDTISKAAAVDDNRMVPDLIFSITDKIQGFTVYQGQILLSQSMGREYDSYLLAYRDIRAEPPHTNIKLAGRDIPLWFLDSATQINKMVMPPLSEGITVVNGRVGILFESAALKFLASGKFAMDQIFYSQLK